MHETEEIKNRLPVEQIVGKYVPLRRAGRVYKGLCPFHNEKTPSFTVNPERGIYKCFGCGKGGDIFDFIIEVEGLTFPEALKLLAEQAGVILEEETIRAAGPASTGPGKVTLYALNAYIAKLWHAVLTQHPKAETAREYLASRGLTPASIDRFSIGYAPSGSATLAGLQKNNFSKEAVHAAGDPSRFQGRITFPICDITGRTVGFTGRSLEVAGQPPPQGPKYWNTPETLLFNKSRTVFALHLAKSAIQEHNLAILAEGQMDVICLHQAGYHHAVASSGTALTAQQLRLIARFSTNIAFAYDGDSAGREATKRGLELALEEELNPYVISIPHGKDPAECLQQDPQSWVQAYEHRLPFMEWLLQELLPSGTPLTPQQKKETARLIVPWLRRIKNPIEQADWIRLVAARLQTDEKNIQEATVRTSHITPTPTSETPLAIVPSTPSTTPLQQRIETALAMLLSFPNLFPQVQGQLSDVHHIPPTPFITYFFTLFPASITELTQSIEGLEEAVRKELYLQVEDILQPYQQIGIDEQTAFIEIAAILQRLRSDSKETAKSEMARQIKSAQASGDTEQVKRLLAELKNLL